MDEWRSDSPPGKGASQADWRGTNLAPRYRCGFPRVKATGRDRDRRNANVKTLLRSNDAVRLSFLCALLRDGGITAFVLDGHTSAVEGSIGAIPRRLAVAEEDESRARRILMEAGEA